MSKINHSLLDSINLNINDPFFVIDHNGSILTINKKAEILFNITNKVKNIFELFDDQTIGKLNDLIDTVFLNNKPLIENIHLILKNKTELNVQSIISSYKDGNEFFVFCTFVQQVFKLELGEITKFKIQTDEIKKIISNDRILEIIDEIKSLYPFTFIGKEKIIKEVNELSELFWIKDVNGFFVLVNNKLASSLGLKTSQIEGKAVHSFLPAYIIDFYNAVENYIKITLNCTVMEGIPLTGISDPNNYQAIEIPLSDSDSNVIAVIGIAQELKKLPEESTDTELLNPFTNILDSFPKPTAFINNRGIIKHGSKEFCKLFSREFSDLRNFSYTKVFPLKLTERIQQFLDSIFEVENFESSIQPESDESSSKNFVVTLNKILGNENNCEGFSILLEETDADDNLERIFNKRGRMFEILIQNNPEPMFIYDTENLRFLEVNEAASALYGYRKDEFLQMDLTDLYTPEDIQTLLDSSRASAKEGKFSGPFKHKKKDGSYIFVEISKISIKYNEKASHFNIIRDVTEKLELEKNNRLFRTTFDNTDNLVFVTDNVGFITLINPSVKKILGYSKKELENTSLASHVKDEDRGMLNSSVFQSHIIDTVTLSTELKNSDGKFVEVELTATPVLNYKEEVESFSIIGKIVAKPVQMQENKVKEVIKEVFIEKPSTSDLKGSEPEDENFLPSLFHELLTPINVILGFVQEITEEIGNLTPEQKEAVDIIQQNRNRLLNTMNSVIEYSNIKNDNFEIIPEEIGITDVIDKLHNEFKEISGARNVEFAYGKISSSLKFESDKSKFQLFISILMKISVQLNKEKKIYFSAFQINEKSFAISLKDNYSFISDYMLNNFKAIFQEQSDNPPIDYGASKLTVKLAKRLFRILKGKFEIIDQGKDKSDCRFVFPVEYTSQVESRIQVEETLKDIEQHTQEEILSESQEHMVKEDSIVDKIPQKEKYEFENFRGERSAGKVEDIHKEFLAGKSVSKSTERLVVSSLSCLYIEDQVDSQILFKVQMKELKDIKFAVGFEDSLPLLDNCHFDFIVMDINLQGEYNGLDALRIIHKMPGLENIPIIAVTAYVLPGDKEKFIASGFNDFISKPIFREKMIDSLEKIFTLKQ